MLQQSKFLFLLICLIKNAEQSTISSNHSDRQISVVGGSNLDLTFKLSDTQTLNMPGVTQPGRFEYTLGGVARNMSEALLRLGITQTKLVSVVADDVNGQYIVNETRKLGMDTSSIVVLSKSENVSSGSYCGVFTPEGELTLALGDMKAHDYITPSLLEQHAETIEKSEMCVLDANVPVETMNALCKFCAEKSMPVWYNPTDIRKCSRIVSSLSKVTYISPNAKELLAIFKDTISKDTTEHFDLIHLVGKYSTQNSDTEIEFEDMKHMLKYLLKYVPFIFFSRGERDLVLASSIKLDLDAEGQFPLKNGLERVRNAKWEPHLFFFPVLRFQNESEIVNVSGAGDSASSGFIAGIIQGYTVKSVIYNGLKAAMLTIKSNRTISPNLADIKLSEIQEIVKQNEQNIKTVSL
jgi:sugar/nucleoside kinase (ribokinase family)